jgi:hypothetical protein
LNNNDILDKCFFLDEAWFHLSGYLNKQNVRIWSAAHEFVETPLHPQKIGVWLAVSRPIFFNQTVPAAKYCNDLLERFLNELYDYELTEGLFSKIMLQHIPLVKQLLI